MQFDSCPLRKKRREFVMALSRKRSAAGRAEFEKAREWAMQWREAGFPEDWPEFQEWASSERKAG